MEFNEKLQELRRRKGLTQEELAQALYVSRTAISKWESGRGYPNIDSLRAIAKFFSVTVDELLSSEEILGIAEKESVQKISRFRDLVFGLFDICSLMLIFLPLFANRGGGFVSSVSLSALGSVQPYLKISFFAIILATAIVGVLTLALKNAKASAILRKISITHSAVTVLLFVLTLHPYAAIFSLALLIIKGFLLTKHA